MRWSELLTIYLAAGAPVGVTYFLRREATPTRFWRVTAATLATLMWPVALFTLRRAGNRAAAARNAGAAANELASPPGGRGIDQAARALTDSLFRVEQIAENVYIMKNDQLARLARTARESIDQYVDLAVAAQAAEASEDPTAREKELCRTAGRTGDDLLIAGRCMHRRNVQRLTAHRDHARAKMISALAGINGVPDRLAGPSPDAARRVSQAILQIYGQAIELLSRLDDRCAVVEVARLLDAECARLRRLESSGDKTTGAESSGERAAREAAAAHSRFGPPAAPLPQSTGVAGS